MENNKSLQRLYNEDTDQYPEFEESVKNCFEKATRNNKHLFKTDATDLFEVYINNITSAEAREHYKCNACKHFIERYGNLVTIDEEGNIESAIWDVENTPKFFRESVKVMRAIVVTSKVTGVFLSSNKTLGYPVTNGWSHLHAKLPSNMVLRNRLYTDGQVMAEKREDFRMLINALTTYDLDTINQAVTILQSEALYRSDRCLGVAEWLRDLHMKRDEASKFENKSNIVWVAVASAPTGFCHVKSSMIGTLLDDIASGMSFDSISRRFAEKMNPSNYMRSQSAPTEGNIAQAEKIVEKLGIANSLIRRYARYEEIPSFIWQNKNDKVVKTAKSTVGGVFGNITPKNKTSNMRSIDLPITTMTWDKFKRTILPTATNIEAKIDNPNRLMALVTASDESAENILQWNNPFSWYYHGGIDGEIKRRVEEAGGRYENNEIRCSLIWEGFTDLDLHCITPNGYHIYYSDKRDRFGGYLDIDMNGLDRNSETPVENIRFSDNAPQGCYKFFVHNYNQSGYNSATPFKAELEINGQVYNFIGEPLRDGQKVTVFEFDYIRGQQPNITSVTSSSNISSDWNVDSEFVKVNGITTSPNTWNEDSKNNSGEHIFFILDGCKDLSEGKGRGFFTEMLKPELREIRKTLDAYTSNTPIEDIDEATACGLGFNKESEWNLILKIDVDNSTRLIKIDRLD